jgi:broad-specificity NMP kinase
MANIAQKGNSFTIANEGNLHSSLPKGVYLLQFDGIRGIYYLEKKEDFVLPTKLYGDHSIVDRWITSWKHESRNMGILLSGIKGSGKTITAQKFCIDSGLPVILISSAFTGDAFTTFITNPALGECIIFIDEFEKVYADKDDQESLLSIMDGAFPTRLVFLLTVNTDELSEFLYNRLKRIKYLRSYENLDYEVIDEVIADRLNNLEHKESIHAFFDIVGIRTFDLLVVLIDEMNLFNEDALTCGRHLNIRREPQMYQFFEVLADGSEMPTATICDFSPEDDDVEIRRDSVDHLEGCPADITSKEFSSFRSIHQWIYFDATASSVYITRQRGKYDISIPERGLHLIAREFKKKRLLF